MTDYIVVGAGSAGCVLAARLSEDPDVSVTLIEAGGASDWRTTVPGLSGALWRTKIDWGFATEPQEAVGRRTMHFPRGKLLGGTSSINYMVYMRGHRDNFDAWRDAGNEGWGYDDVLPLFKKSERNELGEGPYHGGSGPLDVQTLPDRSRATDRLVEATAEVCKVPRDHDFNGATQEGAGRFQTTTRDRRRCSTAVAFLEPARGRPNLTVLTDALVERVVLDRGRAVAVCVRRGGRVEELRADREIILSAGAIGSPHLLMLSGIGPAAHLRDQGVAVVHDAPGVGQNLQDHFFGGAGYGAQGGAAYRFGTLRGIGWLGQYLARRHGPLASNFCESGAFVRTRAGLPRPDLQFHFLPTGQGAEPNTDRANYVPLGSGFIVLATLLYPQSRGQVRLRSADPAAAPGIDPRYLSEAADVRVILDGTRLAQEIAHAPAMKGVTGKPLSPSAEAGVTDATLRAQLQLRGGHIFHPVGTCRMGKGERDVVDDQLRVRGLEGLRVADASIMPDIVGGNTNAACIMIGEKAAELVRGRAARRAFTLIELMIVVAIVGVLAVLAIYGVRKYLANAKSAEATTALGQIASDASMTGNIRNGLCPSASFPVPSSITAVAGRKYQSSASDWNLDSASGAGFYCLTFTMDAPQYYQYSYASTGTGFTATANGDLNGDGIESTFQLAGVLNSSGAINIAPNFTTVNPEE